MCNRVAGADADYCRRGKSDVAGWTVVGDIPICKWKLAWRRSYATFPHTRSLAILADAEASSVEDCGPESLNFALSRAMMVWHNGQVPHGLRSIGVQSQGSF
jgi:hypothetical protein